METRVRTVFISSVGSLLCSVALAFAQNAGQAAVPDYTGSTPIGVALEGWEYPYPVEMLQFDLDGRLVRMAYMDVRPATSNGETVLLFHGKNFASDYWANTLRALSQGGYRAIAPDQIGFGRSSKPEMRYTFDLLAANSVRLLDALQIPRVAVIGNSMGGMLAVHFARRHGDRVTRLVLENPLGLEDYRTSIPPQATPNLVKLEMAQTADSYRTFLKTYFPLWKSDYERFVELFARVQKSAEYPRYALVSALTYQMIYEGPILDELSKIGVPTLLVIGQEDRTVLGRRFAPPESVKSLGNFPQLGKTARAEIPGSKLVEFTGVGHVPHLEVPDRFHDEVLKFLMGR